MIRAAWIRWETVDPAAWERLRGFSTDREQETALGMPDPVQAASWLGGRGLLRWLVVETLGLPVHEARSVLSWNSEGRPFLTGCPGVGVSLSRTDGLVLAAVCTRGPVGVDVENVDRFNSDRLAARRWCGTEALCKASGVGLDWLETAEWEIADDVKEGLVPVDVLKTLDPIDIPCVERWQWSEIALPNPWIGMLVHRVDSPGTVEVAEVGFGTIAP